MGTNTSKKLNDDICEEQDDKSKNDKTLDDKCKEILIKIRKRKMKRIKNNNG